MKEKGFPVNIGMLVEYYIAEPKGSEKEKNKTLVRERAKMPGEPGKYDINYYLRNQVLPAVENILEVFKISTNELLDGKKQMKLGEF